MSTSDPATLQAVANEAGLSVATVSKILGGKYKGNTPKGQERVKRVAELAKRMGYIANASARRLRGGAHHAIIVVVPTDEFGQPAVFAAEYIYGINQALRARDKSLILHTYFRHGDAEQAPPLPSERFYDGALVIDAIGNVDRQLTRSGVPTAFINVDPGPGKLAFMRDERAAGYDLIHALARLGYPRVLLVGETTSNPLGGGHPAYALRYAGITQAIAETGLVLDEVAVPWWSGAIWHEFPQAPITPGTVIVAMDTHTVFIIQRMLLNREVPMACCDDSHQIYELHRGLTRVRFDRMGLGRMAADLLLARIANPIAEVSVAPIRGEVFISDSTPAYSA